MGPEGGHFNMGLWLRKGSNCANCAELAGWMDIYLSVFCDRNANHRWLYLRPSSYTRKTCLQGSPNRYCNDPAFKGDKDKMVLSEDDEHRRSFA